MTASTDGTALTGEPVDLALLSEIAEQRREILKKDLAKPIPDFVLATDQAEVAYTIEPVMLPFALMEFDAFQNELRQKYRLSFSKPSLARSLVSIADDDAKLDSAQVRDLLDDDNLPSDVLQFTGGCFPVGRDDFVPIRSVRLNRETIHVVVQGNSKVADLMVKEIAEELWASTGTPKRWDDIKRMVQMIRYGTATKVNFGIPLEEFLSASVRSFVDRQFVHGHGYATAMTARSARDGFRPAPKTTVAWTVDDVRLSFHVFNLVNGRAESSQFRLTARSRDEVGTGIFAAISELPFDEHVACLEELRAHLTSDATGRK